MTNEHREAAITVWLRSFGLLDQVRLQLWDAAGLTVTQLRLLVYLAEQEGMGNAELADRLMVTRPSVSALLERLERGEFIRREISPDDRRGICIWLEPRGREAVAQMRAEIRGYAHRLMADLTDAESDAIATALTRLVEVGRATRERELAEENQTAEA
ncbi:MAG: MarR family transcriptional regulator [Dehalococcoidia bacterium]|nr:MarR family transcriptional regulator [Dehalococcoidia bacterium]MCA9824355.1 MarR family transcriptional regulator [Dehalococcoidia bacterium]MCA9843497.1 MarR family transcriptional regulator [Dehalococcoidia bacterium]MCA9855450.1 MarR family transcriptional regulator [Dehalococcoidia bacterium]